MTVWVTIKKVPLPFALPSSSSSRPFFLPFFLLVDMFVCACFPGQPQTLFVAENDLKLLILLALSPKYYAWLCGMQGIEPRGSCVLGKHSPN